ncbi:MAG: hypothetical protein ACOZE5_07040 [Verrucomicrobiota bacterium]
MNSTLPNFLANPAAPATGADQFNAAALAGQLPGLPAAAADGGPPPEFAALMPQTTMTAPTVTVQAAPAVLVAAAPAVVTVAAPSQRFLIGEVASSPAMPAGGGTSRFRMAAATESSISATGMMAAGETVGPAPEKPAEVPEKIREQAVAFAAALLQGLLPEPTLASLSAPEGTATANSGSRLLAAGQADPDFGQTVSPEPARLQATPSVASALRPDRKPAGAGLTANGAQPVLAVAPDGAVEFKVVLPSQAAADLHPENPKFADVPVGIRAELELPGQPVVRVEAAGFAAPDAAPASHQENFAGKMRVAGSFSLMSATGVERNFEFTGDKQVKSRSPQAGIGVAQTETTMPAAPTEEPRATRKPQDSTVLPVRAEFQVAQAPAERITAPAPGPAGQTFAGRAVETVTGLVEAQFAASMQKSGSVRLHLKFGGEDLSVHVAIRDGAVHTDFRTDSAPLRAALEREWQAVAAASPGQMQRYAEPVFSPGAARGDTDPSFSQSGEHSRQPAAQQQAQSDAQQQRPPREAFDGASAFARRSLVGGAFVPEPAAPRVPALLPTSLRLSALA